jgi:general stress protein CsbA
MRLLEKKQRKERGECCDKFSRHIFFTRNDYYAYVDAVIMVHTLHKSFVRRQKMILLFVLCDILSLLVLYLVERYLAQNNFDGAIHLSFTLSRGKVLF